MDEPLCLRELGANYLFVVPYFVVPVFLDETVTGVLESSRVRSVAMAPRLRSVRR